MLASVYSGPPHGAGGAARDAFDADDTPWEVLCNRAIGRRCAYVLNHIFSILPPVLVCVALVMVCQSARVIVP